MQVKIKDRVIYKCSVKRLLYTICFFLICIIEQRIKTSNQRDGWYETFRDMTGVVLAVITMLHYRLDDFKRWKIPYLVWSAICVVGAPFAFVWGVHNRTFPHDWTVILISVILYGYIIIHTFISVVLEKNYTRPNRKFLAVWLLMMILMVVSRSRYIWPLSFLLMFGCYYLTDCSKETQEDFFQGMLDGIILGFFALQGFSLAFRPYDNVRYAGAFLNPNLNALFYIEVLAAVFAKILCAAKYSAGKLVKLYYWIGAGVVLSFELLTLGRSGWLTAIVLIFAFLKFLGKFQVPKRWWKNAATLSLCVLLTFPLCFGAVRYIPPLFHHPVLFWGDLPANRVTSEDKWDSEKYVDLDEYMEAALGRIFDSFANLLDHSPFLLNTDAAEIVDEGAADIMQEDTEEELPPNKVPVLTDEQGKDAFLVRKTIYSYYFTHLNLRGYPNEEQGFQLQENYWIGHAHNIFLQYGTDFGIPVMLLFAVLIVWGAVILWRRFMRDDSVEDAVSWMFLLIPAVFGMFEYAWGMGSLSIFMLFTAWKRVVCSGEK